MFDPLEAGIVRQGLIAVRHVDRNPPVLTYPPGTFWHGQPSLLPKGLFVEGLNDPRVNPCADLELERAWNHTQHWHWIVTAPMPYRILLALEEFGGVLEGTQPELATLICVSLDSWKRGVAHYKTLHKICRAGIGVGLTAK